MGQSCCVKFFNKTEEKGPETENKRTALMVDSKRLAFAYNTPHDRHFTYFLGVFELKNHNESTRSKMSSSSMQQPPQPLPISKPYPQLVEDLGKFIQSRSNQDSQSFKRIKKDSLTVLESRQKLGFGKSKLPGCLIKLQIQGIIAEGASEFGVSHHHPQLWEGKFSQWKKMQELKEGPIYIQFVVPEIFSSIIKISTRPKHYEVEFNLDECFEEEKRVFCQVRKWKNGKAGGIAFRMQLFDGKDEEDKLEQMRQLYYSLKAQIQPQINPLENNPDDERYSRHRSSLHHQYNLNKNDMF